MTDIRALLFTVLALGSACASDAGLAPNADWSPTTGSGEELLVQEYVELQPRSEQLTYGLPSEGMSSVADLIALLPTEAIDRSQPSIFASAGAAIESPLCQGGGSTIVPQLPITIEGVVTLHPRLYVKTEICSSDERFYGSFVVEDDTGGILVLRDSRVAPFNTGDRVRMTVEAVVVTFGLQPETRAVLVADYERIPSARTEVLYSEQVGALTAADVGRTRRIRGVVVQSPTNDNFSSMLLADRELPPPSPGFKPTAVCEELCSGPCNRVCPSDDQIVCRRLLCPSVCEALGNEFDRDTGEPLLPAVCWNVSLDAELIRRGISPPVGTDISVTGPVGSSFGLKIWVQKLGQLIFHDTTGDLQ